MHCIRVPLWFIGLLKIILIILFFNIVTTLVIFISARRIIADHWDEYRCNPLIIPFASLFGYDPTETMTQCSFATFKATSGSMFTPFTNMAGGITGVLGEAGNAMGGLSGLLASVQNTFVNGFSDVLGRVGNIGSSIQYLIIKIEVLLQRLTAILVVAMYSLYSILQSLRAVKNNKPLLSGIDKILKFPKI